MKVNFLTKHVSGSLGMFIIVMSIFIAVFAYFIAPDNSPYGNTMHLELSTLKPGSTVSFLRFPKKNPIQTSFMEQLLSGVVSPFTSIPIRSYEQKDSIISYVSYSSNLVTDISLDQLLISNDQNPAFTQTFYLGTDKYGRDLLSRLLIATRISLSVGFIAVFISLLIGITLGLVSGYYGSWVDALILWFINVVWSIPTLLMVIAISLALGKGFWQVFVAVGLTMWVEVARGVRGQGFSLKQLDYIQAAKVLGFGGLRIMFGHILPNIMSPIIVISAANFAAAILIEAGLSFLGIGVQAPIPSWGSMIKNHYSYIILDKAYLAFAPGLTIMLLVLALMYVGNMLRSYLNVKG